MRDWCMRGRVWLAVLGVVWLYAGSAVLRADSISYQGKLTDAAGTPVDGEVRMVFRLWFEGNHLSWSETQAVVNVRSGLFSVSLGEINPLPRDLFRIAGVVEPYSWYLGMQVGGDAEMAPRIPIHPVPQAYAARWARRASEADTAITAYNADAAGTADSAAYATRAGSADTELWSATGSHVYRPAGGNVGIGVANPAHSLHVYRASGDVRATIQAGTGNASLRLDNGSGNPTVEFRRSGDYRGAFGYDATRDNLFAYHNGTIAFKDGKLGVNMHAPEHTLDVNGSIRVTGQAQGTFPRPNYDSGWLTYSAGGQFRTLNHNLGGNRDNYVVDIMARTTDGMIHNIKYGGGSRYRGNEYDDAGFNYLNLTTTQIQVQRIYDDTSAQQIRVRIWVYN